jgi:DtxR family Mn-dependent transcriptional regulator
MPAKIRKPAAGPEIGRLSESLEDYIEIIYRLIADQKVARVRDIARAKVVKMSSAVSALKRLDREKLARYEAREFVELTTSGIDLARRLLRRHEFLTRFLIDVLQVDPEIAESDACSMEHALSLETMQRFYAFSEFIQSRTNGFHNLVESYKKTSAKRRRRTRK